ncbi:MAG: hypothetical protein HN353_09395 [Bdellovibrionales bacterium]|jgi:hypothetical protein|nr:hypothetical protein [Bdellovibrionales bacterium]MBT3527347.1 hypothetical protein [Bdellovibrionales bacterium]MBT7669452.1 hypothetical protein [Bdellovibrionales bacterium]MBT7768316.1 hypothetical protein [Bdellovibrionales bacterium]
MVAGVREIELIKGPGGRLIEAEQMVAAPKAAAAKTATVAPHTHAAVAKSAGLGLSLGGWGPVVIFGLIAAGGYYYWKHHHQSAIKK